MNPASSPTFTLVDGHYAIVRLHAVDAVPSWARGRLSIMRRKVATHWIAIFAAIPAFLGGLVLLKSASLPLGVAAVVGGVLTMGVLHTFLVPLVRSDT